jgi:hypothetical protein
MLLCVADCFLSTGKRLLDKELGTMMSGLSWKSGHKLAKGLSWKRLCHVEGWCWKMHLGEGRAGTGPH